MRQITKILHIEKWVKDGKEYTRTHAILDNDEEARGFGEFKVGDEVEAFFNDKWDYYQMKPHSGIKK